MCVRPVIMIFTSVAYVNWVMSTWNVWRVQISRTEEGTSDTHYLESVCVSVCVCVCVTEDNNRGTQLYELTYIMHCIYIPAHTCVHTQ